MVYSGKFNSCKKVYPCGVNKITTFNRDVFNPFGLRPLEEEHIKVRSDYSKSNNITRSDSLKRGIDKIYDIAILNDFDYFITFTLDSSKIDRYDYKEIQKKLKVWLQNAVSRYNAKYLIVPELHKDGAVHFHGLISGDFSLVFSGKVTSKGQPIYNLKNWKYGFTTAIPLDDNKVAIAKYICKYITKDTKMILGNLYYSGGGVVREPDKEYSCIPYYQASGVEYEIPLTQLKVKYSVEVVQK